MSFKLISLFAILFAFSLCTSCIVPSQQSIKTQAEGTQNQANFTAEPNKLIKPVIPPDGNEPVQPSQQSVQPGTYIPPVNVPAGPIHSENPAPQNSVVGEPQ